MQTEERFYPGSRGYYNGPMTSAGKLKILHLTSHLDVGGITRYIQLLGTSMARQGHETAVLSGGGRLDGEFGRGGLKTYQFPVRKKSILNPFLYIPLKKIAALIRREKFDVIHSHTRVTHALAFFLSRMTKVPAVNTYHGYFKNLALALTGKLDSHFTALFLAS